MNITLLKSWKDVDLPYLPNCGGVGLKLGFGVVAFGVVADSSSKAQISIFGTAMSGMFIIMVSRYNGGNLEQRFNDFTNPVPSHHNLIWHNMDFMDADTRKWLMLIVRDTTLDNLMSIMHSLSNWKFAWRR